MSGPEYSVFAAVRKTPGDHRPCHARAARVARVVVRGLTGFPAGGTGAPHAGTLLAGMLQAAFFRVVTVTGQSQGVLQNLLDVLISDRRRHAGRMVQDCKRMSRRRTAYASAGPYHQRQALVLTGQKAITPVATIRAAVLEGVSLAADSRLYWKAIRAGPGLCVRPAV